MALASLGARTPLVTSTLSNAVTFASPGVAAKFGLDAAGVASALVEFVELSFAVFPSLLPAMTGTAVMARTNKLEIHFFSVDMDGVSSFFRPAQAWAHTWGAKLMHLHERCQGWLWEPRVPFSSGPGTARGWKRYVVLGNDSVTQVTDHRDSSSGARKRRFDSKAVVLLFGVKTHYAVICITAEESKAQQNPRHPIRGSPQAREARMSALTMTKPEDISNLLALDEEYAAPPIVAANGRFKKTGWENVPTRSKIQRGSGQTTRPALPGRANGTR